MTTAHEHEAIGRPIKRSIPTDARSVGVSSRPRRDMCNAGQPTSAQDHFWKNGPFALIWEVKTSSSRHVARVLAQLLLAQMASKSPFLGVTDHSLQLPTTPSAVARCPRDRHDRFLLQSHDMLEERSITKATTSRIGPTPTREFHHREDAGRCRDSAPPQRADCRYVVQPLFFFSRGGCI